MKMRMTIALIFGLTLATYAGSELTLNQSATYAKSGLNLTLSTFSGATTVNGNGMLQNVQLISTNTLGDLVEMGSITNQGFAAFRNLGPSFVGTNMAQTNILQIGRLDSASAFCPFLELDSNRTASCWVSTNALRARALGTNSVFLNAVILDR